MEGVYHDRIRRAHRWDGKGARAARGLMEIPSGRPLLRAVDHGPSVRLEAITVGAAGERWVEPFLEANRAQFRRLGVRAEVEARGGIALRLTPGPRIGAVPLLSPEAHRPAAEPMRGSEWIVEATQAMGWVSEERGLGGARTLDGMSWDLPVDELWEAWVGAFVAELAPRCGMTAPRRGDTTRRLNWATPTSSMRMLVPDTGLRGTGRLVWIDAKYKAHLQLLAQRGWSGLEESTRDAHRADLHQALAYASLDEVERVDSVLVYPELGVASHRPAIATVAAGRRRVRLLLASLPFGFRSQEHREETLAAWRELLTA